MTTAKLYPRPVPATPIGQVGAPEAPPWDVGNSDVAERRREASQATRWDLMRYLWKSSSLPAVRSCRLHSLGAGVSLIRHDRGASWAGLQTCSSIWACPLCSARIRVQRAARIEASVRAWSKGAEGRSVVFLTLTVRHQQRDSLPDLYEALTSAWRGLRQGWWWRSLGWRGFWRSTEVTWGINGWHPHLHVLLFADGPVDVDQVGAEISRRWQAAVVAEGLRPTTLARGARLQPVTVGGPSMGEYLSKVLDGDGESWDVGSELARSDVKRGRKGLSPMQVLERAADGDRRMQAVWRHYEQATYGRRAIESSRGLAELTGVDELTDEEANADDLELGEFVLRLTPLEYQRLALSGWAGRVLAIATREEPPETVRFVHQLLQLCSGSSLTVEAPQ